jgi:hypothetical protein
MSRSRLLVLLVLGNALGLGGAAMFAIIGGPRGVIPAAVFLLSLDALAVRCVTRYKPPAEDN